MTDTARPHLRRRRLVPAGIVGALVAASAIAGAATGLAMSGDPAGSSDPAPARAHSHPEPAPQSSVPTTTGVATLRGGGGLTMPPGHGHAGLAPYRERRAAGSREEQAAADQLVEDVRETLSTLADADTAIAAGFRPALNPRGATVHYRNPTHIRDGNVLDPDRPEGLVFFTREGVEPVLLGAFFVARPGVDAPTPAGDLAVWHSHDPSCAAFFATPEAPCTDTRRMLHIWSIDQTTLTRRNGTTVAVRVTDPFGAPFGASVEGAR